MNHIILRAVLRLQPSIEFRAASDSGLRGLKDPDVLETTARDGRVLVTHDQSTMPMELAKFLESRSHPGGIVAPQHLATSAVADDLLLIWEASEAEEWVNGPCYLPI